MSAAAISTAAAPVDLSSTRDLMALLVDGNRADDGTLVLPSEYLEVVVTRR